jgi:hypothetical protein
MHHGSSEFFECSRSHELESDVIRDAAGSTNASDCSACPAGSYANASGGMEYFGAKLHI